MNMEKFLKENLNELLSVNIEMNNQKIIKKLKVLSF